MTPGPESAAVEVRDLRRVFQRPRNRLFEAPPEVTALDGVGFEVAPGERFGIVGESGSGKSTLLRLIAALDRPTSGEVLVEGRTVSNGGDLRWLRRTLQVVFQDPMGSLDPRMRVGKIIAEPLAAQPASERPDRSGRVAELLEAVGLPAEAAQRYPHQFSGGQRQRISIARALAPGPKILLADEPVSALDVSVRAQVLNLIDDLVDRFGLTLVFISHDLGVVRHLCDRVAVMRDGRIVETGETARVYDEPHDDYTRALVRAVPTMAGALAGSGPADLLHHGDDPELVRPSEAERQERP